MSPIKTYTSMFTAVALPNFIPLLRSQTYPTRRSLAGEIAQSLIRNRTRISTESNLEAVLEILKVLVKEGLQQPGYSGGPIRRGQETDETIEEQGWLARIVHLIHSSDNDTQFKVCHSDLLRACCMLTGLSLHSSSKWSAATTRRATTE